jgi:DNA-binding MarR family transcriptional regulator
VLDQTEGITKGERVPVRLSKREWDLVVEHAYLALEVEEEIRTARVDSGMASVSLTPGDLDALVGWMAAAANHAGGRDLMIELSRLGDRLSRFQDQHARKLVIFGSQDLSAPSIRYTAKQGQYLAFIYYYTKIHGVAPAEADMQRYFGVSAPSVHQMVVALEASGLIERTPGQARSIRLRVSRHEIPDLD